MYTTEDGGYFNEKCMCGNFFASVTRTPPWESRPDTRSEARLADPIETRRIPFALLSGLARIMHEHRIESP
jgi:hypothetical protein